MADWLELIQAGIRALICGHGGNAETLPMVRRRHSHVCSDSGHSGVLRRFRIVERRDPVCRHSFYSGCHAVIARRSMVQSTQRQMICMVIVRARGVFESGCLDLPGNASSTNIGAARLIDGAGGRRQRSDDEGLEIGRRQPFAHASAHHRGRQRLGCADDADAAPAQWFTFQW